MEKWEKKGREKINKGNDLIIWAILEELIIYIDIF